MKFCKECGHRLNDGAAFCPECGQAVTAEGTTAPATSPASDGQPDGGSGPAIRLTRSMKIALCSFLAFLLLLWAGYHFGASVYSKENAIEKLKEAISSGDKETLAELLYSDDPRLKIRESDIENFLAYFEEHPSFQSSLIRSLSVQAEALAHRGENELAMEAVGDIFANATVLKLTQNGNQLLFFDNYQFEVQPFYLTVTTNIKGARIYIDDELAATADHDDYSIELGPLLPGIYTVKTELKNKYATLKHEDRVELMIPGDNGETIDLDLEAGYVHLGGSDLNGTLVVNGKNTGLKVNDTERFGPIPLDGSVKIQVVNEFPWGRVLSETQVVEGTYIEFDELTVSEKTRKSVMNIINQYAKSAAKAFNTLKPVDYLNVTDRFRKKLGNDLQAMKDSSSRWEARFLKSVFDLDSFQMDMEGQPRLSVDTAIHYRMTNTASSEQELQDYSWHYELIYDETAGKWVIDHEERTWPISTDNIKVFVIGEGNGKPGAGKKEENDIRGDKNTVPETVRSLMENYEENLVKAINQGNFSLVEPYLVPQSDLYKAQKQLVSHLHEEGTTEELISFNVKDVRFDNNKKVFKIDVYEEFNISYGNGESKVKTFNWTYTAKTSEGTLKLSKIEKG